MYILKNILIAFLNLNHDDVTGVLPGTKENVTVTYQHGGYPPLTLRVIGRHLVVTARSDPNYFVRRKGCKLTDVTEIREGAAVLCNGTKDEFGKQVRNNMCWFNLKIFNLTLISSFFLLYKNQQL